MVKSKKEKIPKTFKTPEEAGAFWDKHSLADYKDQTKSVPMDFKISGRKRCIEVPEKVCKKPKSK